MRYLSTAILALVTLLSLESCYRMPAKDEYSVIPLTNNPDFNRDHGDNDQMTPGMSY